MITLFSRTEQRDLELLSQITIRLEELWEPLRFLDDLRTVWPSLSTEERSEIEASRVYQDKDHQRRAEAMVVEIGEKVQRVKSYKFRSIRQDTLDFLGDWGSQEPDTIKIITAIIYSACKK